MPFAETPNARIFYEQFGEGPDLVWVHGGGAMGKEWQDYQVPYFKAQFRNTTFDNRGVGPTVCDAPGPWTIRDLSDDLAALIEQVCEPPVVVVGLSMGSIVIQELLVDHPHLVASAICMGTIAHADGWVRDYMQAEIDWRKAGNRLDGLMAVCHSAAQLYPSEALADNDTWEEIKAATDDEVVAATEDSLILQWQACNDYDGRERLKTVTVPLDVIGFEQDVQAPPRHGREVADLVPGARFHMIEGAGHSSTNGHLQDVINPFIAKLIAERAGTAVS